MEENTQMTYIEFFDHTAVENICACLAQVPTRVVLVGDDAEELEFHCKRYEQLFHKRGFKELTFVPWPTQWDKLQTIVDSLGKIVETYENCIFGLTGGDDLYLVAMGMVSERYRDKNVRMHRFLLEEGDILDCDQDGVTIGKNRQPKLSVEENIFLYGGRVIYEKEKTGTTRKWNMNEEFREDIGTMWEICCTWGNRSWNEQMEVLRCVVQASGSSGTDLHVLRQRVENLLQKEDLSLVTHQDILQDLLDAKLLTFWSIDGVSVEVGFKNDQIKACLSSAGRLLELVVYMAALDARDSEGEKVYNNSLTGVYIDWDGKLSTQNGGEDSHNEIDVLMMHGVVPVFVSCKNGYVSVDELYKLEVVAEQFGSSYAKKVLVAPALDIGSKHGKYIENRAKDMQIRLITSLSENDPEQRSQTVAKFWKEEE